MSLKKQQNKQQANQLNEGAFADTIRVISVCLATFFICLVMSMCGCTEQVKRVFRDAAVSVSDCAFHTSLGCASQATAGCDKPSEGEGYGEFGKCLVNRSASCSGRGLGLCLLKGIANAVGTTSVAAGGVGCVNDSSLQEIESCVSDVSLETESEAVSAVAYCYRVACMGE